MKKTCIIVIVLLLIIGLSGMPCIINYTFGIPCPGCGMTRAYIALLKLDIEQAFTMHPLFWTLPLIFTIYCIDRKKALCLKAIIVIAVLFILVYIYRMAIFFPHTEPMLFNKESILYRILNR